MAEPEKKKRVRKTSGLDSVEKTIARWKAQNMQLDCNKISIRKVQAKGSRKGCMRGKGGPENLECQYRGVRQRTWGKWVAEIREPYRGKRLWLGTFATAFEGSLAYDIAARAMYGPRARVNHPDSGTKAGASSVITSVSDESTTTSHHSSSGSDESKLSNPKVEADEIRNRPPPPLCVKAETSSGSDETELYNPKVETDEIRSANPSPPPYPVEADPMVTKDEPKEEAMWDIDHRPQEMFDVEDLLRELDADLACGTYSGQDMKTLGNDQFGGVDSNNYWQGDDLACRTNSGQDMMKTWGNDQFVGVDSNNYWQGDEAIDAAYAGWQLEDASASTWGALHNPDADCFVGFQSSYGATTGWDGLLYLFDEGHGAGYQ